MVVIPEVENRFGQLIVANAGEGNTGNTEQDKVGIGYIKPNAGKYIENEQQQITPSESNNKFKRLFGEWGRNGSAEGPKGQKGKNNGQYR